MSLRLSRFLLAALAREAREAHGVRVSFLAMTGEVHAPGDRLARIEAVRRSRTFALHESVTQGEPECYTPLPGLHGGLVPLESDRLIQGALLVGETLVSGTPEPRAFAAQSLVTAGLSAREAGLAVRRLPILTSDELRRIVRTLSDDFYRRSGWTRPLLAENRLRTLQQRQIAEAIALQEKAGGLPVYPFEKERILLSFIKAGDRESALRVLNEMLAAMYLTSPQLPVLRFHGSGAPVG